MRHTWAEADIIKIAVVITAIPRWTGALLEAEGVPLPDEWRVGWRISVAVLSIGMAIAEAFAISYMLNAWRVQHDRGARWLLAFAVATIVVFCAVLAPYVAANVHHLALGDVLGTGWLWWAWSVAVPASTGITVWGVGYAQKRRETSGEGGAQSGLPGHGDRSHSVSPRRWPDKAAFLADTTRPDDLTTRQIMELAGVDDRTARRWRAAARSENGRG